MPGQSAVSALLQKSLCIALHFGLPRFDLQLNLAIPLDLSAVLLATGLSRLFTSAQHLELHRTTVTSTSFNRIVITLTLDVYTPISLTRARIESHRNDGFQSGPVRYTTTTEDERRQVRYVKCVGVLQRTIPTRRACRVCIYAVA
jgi:hypothetical protein